MQLEHGAYTVTFSISQERMPGPPGIVPARRGH